MIVLSFSGKAGAGKDSAANALMEQMTTDGLRVRRISFAGKLKDACCVLYGWDRDRLESDPFYKEGGLGGWVSKDKPGMIPIRDIDGHLKAFSVHELSLSDFVELDEDPICVLLGMTRRVIMQKVGTEAFRDQIHRDHWVILVQAMIDRGEFDDVDIGFITDARFANELSFARNNNGMNIMVQRADEGTLTQHTSHASEQEWQQQKTWDVILTNNIAAGLDELKRNVVRTVYTALVQGGMKNFPFHIQTNLVNGSLFGIASRMMPFPNEALNSRIHEHMIPVKPVPPASPFAMAKDRARATIDEAIVDVNRWGDM